jgi:hypothetical protein
MTEDTIPCVPSGEKFAREHRAAGSARGAKQSAASLDLDLDLDLMVRRCVMGADVVALDASARSIMTTRSTISSS